MKPISRILIVINQSKDGAWAIADQLGKIAHKRGVDVTQSAQFPLERDALCGMDLCIVIGGDGTILGVVGAATHSDVPVLGINLGTLGFMANFSADEAERAFLDILEGHGAISERRLLECYSASGKHVLALNDLVIKAYSSRLVRLHVHTDGQEVNEYYADGLIIATPTGSTAYNLSAGGPIIHPAARAIVLNPINPHTLTTRSIVLDEQAELTIEIQHRFPNVQVAADGVEVFEEADDFPIRVCVCQRRTFRLLQHPAYSHFHILRTKLHWTGNTPTRLQ